MNPVIEWFDANAQIGRQAIHGPGAPSSAAELIAEMDRIGIARALVYHAHAAGLNPRAGNRFLMEELKAQPSLGRDPRDFNPGTGAQPRLVPAWVLAPEFDATGQASAGRCAELIASGGRAARLLLREQLFELRLWNLGGLLQALSDRRIPTWLDFGISSWTANATDWNGLAEVLAAFPNLPLVLVRPDISSGRRLFALMEKHPHLYVETSYYTVHQGLAEICRLFGAQRILFGSGLPFRAAGPAMTAVLYQPLSAEERRLIAGANLERLLSEVCP